MDKKAMSFIVGMAAGAAVGFLLLPGSKTYGRMKMGQDHEPEGAHEPVSRHAERMK